MWQPVLVVEDFVYRPWIQNWERGKLFLNFTDKPKKLRGTLLSTILFVGDLFIKRCFDGFGNGRPAHGRGTTSLIFDGAAANA